MTNQTLVLYGYSGFDITQRENLTRIITGIPECAIVLMEDGVVGINTREINPFQAWITANIPIYFLQEDAEARGLKPESIQAPFKKITYHDLIDLIEQTPRVVSWL
jgi:sulfur relay protein TusB/DsrH